jgi:adenosylhomocysteine nucleosidase
MTLVIKTGMTDEQRIAQAYAAPGTVVLTGVQTVAKMQQLISPNCTGIISFGLCGGLAPAPIIGQIFIGDILIGPNGETYQADPAWRQRLFAKTKAYERHWYSSGLFNTANTPAERASLYKSTGAWVIDDESLFVAQFAKARGIPFQILRSVSDAASDTVPPAARNALNQNGSSDIEEVLKSVVPDPEQIPDLIRIGNEYYQSLAELRTAAIQIGPTFQLE